MANKIKEKCDPVKHTAIASIETDNSTESTEDVVSITINVGKEFQEVLELSTGILCYVKRMISSDKGIEKRIFEDILSMTEKMNALFYNGTNPEKTTLNDIVILASAYLFTSIVHKTLYTYTMDRLQLCLGQECVLQCLELLQTDAFDRRCILIYMKALYEAECIYKAQGHSEIYKHLLYQSMNMYIAYTQGEKNYPAPIEVINICFPNEEKIDSRNVLNGLYANSVHSLGEFYFSESGHIDHQKAIMYTHRALNLYLNNALFTHNDYVQWAIKSSKLSIFLMNHSHLTEARHHLAAASFILQKFHDEICMNTDQEKCSDLYASNYELYHKASAVVTRNWARYGIHLLRLSYKKLLHDEKGDEFDKKGNSELRFSTDSSVGYYENLTFHVIEEKLEGFTALITDDYLLNYNDVKVVFDKVLKWLHEAKIHITPEKYLYDYVVLILDISKAYKYLAYFIKDRHEWIKLHKYRSEILEDVVQILDPEIHRDYCRRIWIELATVYSALIDKYFECTRSNTVITKETDKHIDYLINNIIYSLQSFSLSETADNKWMELL